MIKATVKGRYDADAPCTAVSVTVDGGDVKLRASVTNAIFVNGPSLNDLTLSLEKPGSFSIDYCVPKKDVGFEFMDTATIMGKPLTLAYTHWKEENRTELDGTLVIDPANKISASYGFGTRNCKLKYRYVHGGSTTLEPGYDLAKNSWDFAVSQRVLGDDVVRASYQSFTRNLGLEWSKSSSANGTFKVIASVNLADKSKVPKISAESTWNFEM